MHRRSFVDTAFEAGLPKEQRSEPSKSGRQVCWAIHPPVGCSEAHKLNASPKLSKASFGGIDVSRNISSISSIMMILPKSIVLCAELAARELCL